MLRLVALLAALGACVQAHRLDEYLQAALISLEPDNVSVELNLTPGVAVFGRVLALLDADGDGMISPAEERAYAKRVLSDVSLVIDKHPRGLEITGAEYPPIDQMREGLGTIRLKLHAAFGRLPDGPHELRLENHHHPEIGAFLANALVPPESVSIERQSRDDRQTTISIVYSVHSPEMARVADSHFVFAVLLCAAALSAFLLKVTHRLAEDRSLWSRLSKHL